MNYPDLCAIEKYTATATAEDNPCVSHLCWEKAVKGKAYCPWHEVVYIAKHDHPSPPIADADAWRKELFDQEMTRGR